MNWPEFAALVSRMRAAQRLASKEPRYWWDASRLEAAVDRALEQDEARRAVESEHEPRQGSLPGVTR
jgi:hypothetical protein